ncbi:MAG: hypothetical protein IJH67_02310, partial [Thermoguttaceae bacterium]|nr:hypothetical protein [Thermoguttaceae bacterium]
MKQSAFIFLLLIYYNIKSFYSKHFFKNFFKICIAFAGKILGEAGRLLGTAGKNSQKTPRKLPENSQKTPRKLPENSQKTPRKLPENSQKTPR